MRARTWGTYHCLLILIALVLFYQIFTRVTGHVFQLYSACGLMGLQGKVVELGLDKNFPNKTSWNGPGVRHHSSVCATMLPPGLL